MRHPTRLLPLALLVSTAVSAPSAPAHAQSDAYYAAEWQLAYVLYHFTEWAAPPGPFSLRRRVIRSTSIEIDAPIDHVFEVYSDVGNHVGHHPFLQRVVNHRTYVNAQGEEVRDFTALEDVPIAGIPVRTNTHAQQRIDADNYVYETDTWSAPDIILHQVATFEDLGNGRTRITETIAFEADFLLIDFTVSNGMFAHEATMQSLKEAIENGDFL